MSLTANERALRARLGGLTRWSTVSDRSAATQPGRSAFDARFEREVDPDSTLPLQERALRAEAARKAYFTKLALKSATSRRKASEARQRAEAAEAELAAAEAQLAATTP